MRARVPARSVARDRPHPARRRLLAWPLAAAAASVAGASSLAPPVGDAPGDTYWQLVKRQYLVEPGVTWLNSGTCGLQTHETHALEAAIRAGMAANFNRYFGERLVAPGFRGLCEAVARALGADVDGLAFTSGATEAMNFIAGGLDLAAGDEILTTTHEHQAGIYPWMLAARRRGATVRQMPWPSPVTSAAEVVDLVNRAIGPRTRVLSLCHVTYTDGTVLPVQALCALAHDRGLVAVVDGAQSPGMIEVDVRSMGCDFFATSLHKWFGAPYGTGALWVAPPWRDRHWPTIVESYDGWSAEDRDGARASRPGLDFVENWPPAMVKYGTNVHYYGAAFWAVAPAVALHETIGRARVAARVGSLATRLIDALARVPRVSVLTPADPALRGGLVSFRADGVDARALARALAREDRLVVRSVVHESIGFAAVRASTHLCNDEDDVDRLVAAVRRRLTA